MSAFKDEKIKFLQFRIEALKKQNQQLTDELELQKDNTFDLHAAEKKPLDRYPLCKQRINKYSTTSS